MPPKIPSGLLSSARPPSPRPQRRPTPHPTPRRHGTPAARFGAQTADDEPEDLAPSQKEAISAAAEALLETGGSQRGMKAPKTVMLDCMRACGLPLGERRLETLEHVVTHIRFADARQDAQTASREQINARKKSARDLLSDDMPEEMREILARMEPSSTAAAGDEAERILKAIHDQTYRLIEKNDVDRCDELLLRSRDDFRLPITLDR